MALFDKVEAQVKALAEQLELQAFAGAQQFASVRGYISTARKNSVSIFTAIKNAFSGDPFIPALQF